MRLSLLAAALLTALTPQLATAHQVKHKALQIVHPWAHESPAGGATEASVFMTIRNKGRTADRLVSASTSRAAEARLIGGTSTAFAVKPGKELTLSVAHGHVHLLGLTKPLYMHDNFALTLVFEKAGRIEVEVHIEAARVEPPHKH